jgi:hypothetical protein
MMGNCASTVGFNMKHSCWLIIDSDGIPQNHGISRQDAIGTRLEDVGYWDEIDGLWHVPQTIEKKKLAWKWREERGEKVVKGTIYWNTTK